MAGWLTVERADLTNPAKLGLLYDRLRDRGELADGPAARIRFAGAAARAAECGTNPGGLFRWLLKEIGQGRKLDWITQEQENCGLRCLAGQEDGPRRPRETAAPARVARPAPPAVPSAVKLVSAPPPVSVIGQRPAVAPRTDAETVAWAEGWAIIRSTDPAAVLRKKCGWDDGRITLALAAVAGQAGIGACR